MTRAKKATAPKRSRKKAEPKPVSQADRDAWIIAEQRRILAEHDSASRPLDKPADDVPPAPQATDADGNVRPADPRFLTDDQVAEQQAHVEAVQEQADDETKAALEQTKAAQEILENAGSSAVPSTDDDEQEALPNV